MALRNGFAALTERRHIDGQWSDSDIAGADLRACAKPIKTLSYPPAGNSVNSSLPKVSFFISRETCRAVLYYSLSQADASPNYNECEA